MNNGDKVKIKRNYTSNEEFIYTLVKDFVSSLEWEVVKEFPTIAPEIYVCKTKFNGKEYKVPLIARHLDIID